MSKLIYLNTSAASQYDSEDSKCIYEDMTLSGRLNRQPLKSGNGPADHFRCSRLAAGCLGLLCVLLLIAIVALCVWFTTERYHLQTSNNNLTIERDQLQNINDVLQEQKDGCDLAGIMQGWRCFGSSMYYISNEKKSWRESRNDCRQREADLVIINSKEEQDFIESLRRDLRTWIGLTDGDTEGEWKWVDGTVLGTGYWEPGKPNAMGWFEQDCAVTGSAQGKGWNDKSCREFHFWICEKQVLS